MTHEVKIGIKKEGRSYLVACLAATGVEDKWGLKGGEITDRLKDQTKHMRRLHGGMIFEDYFMLQQLHSRSSVEDNVPILK